MTNCALLCDTTIYPYLEPDYPESEVSSIGEYDFFPEPRIRKQVSPKAQRLLGIEVSYPKQGSFNGKLEEVLGFEIGTRNPIAHSIYHLRSNKRPRTIDEPSTLSSWSSSYQQSQYTESQYSESDYAESYHSQMTDYAGCESNIMQDYGSLYSLGEDYDVVIDDYKLSPSQREVHSTNSSMDIGQQTTHYKMDSILHPTTTPPLQLSTNPNKSKQYQRLSASRLVSFLDQRKASPETTSEPYNLRSPPSSPLNEVMPSFLQSMGEASPTLLSPTDSLRTCCFGPIDDRDDGKFMALDPWGPLKTRERN